MIGILAVQGGVREHELVLDELGVQHRQVRRVEHLNGLSGIILPGGESTTMSKLLELGGLLRPLIDALTSGLPAYGTCAGMILLASEVLDTRPSPVPAVFIRAPWVERVGDGVEVLATVPSGPASGAVVAVRSGRVLATSFHPECTGDARVHEMFLAMVSEAGYVHEV